VIVSKSKVGAICDKEIWKLEKFEIIPYNNNLSGLTENEVEFRINKTKQFQTNNSF